MAILQAKVHNEFQGRVLTMFGTLIYLSSPIGLAIAGPLADRFGVQMWYVIAGFLCFLVLGLVALSTTTRNLEDEKIRHPYD